MNKNISSLFIIAFLLFLSINKFHSLYAGTKYLGENWDSFKGGTSAIKFKGNFDLNPSEDTGADSGHWLMMKNNFFYEGYALGGGLYPQSGEPWNTSLTAEGSPGSILLEHAGDGIAYMSGGIDIKSALATASVFSALFFSSQWGEGNEIMDNYTHLGFFLYVDEVDASDSLGVQLLEWDQTDTMWGDVISGTVYTDIDAADTFPAGFGNQDNDGDALVDAGLEGWLARVRFNFKGWQYVLLRLGNINGSGQDELGGKEYAGEDTKGDFFRNIDNATDGRWNIREIRGAVGNYLVDIGDAGDSFIINTAETYEDELDKHYEDSDGPGTTLPYTNGADRYWVRGDVGGLSSIGFVRDVTSRQNCYIDNVVFTTPNPGATDTSSMRVDYAWLSDSIKTTLYDTSDTPLVKYLKDYIYTRPITADVNMSTFYGSLWYDITGFIPPTFSALLDGTDVSETMSRISIVKQSNWPQLLNPTVHRYYHGNIATMDTTKSPNNGSNGIFASPSVDSPPMSYDAWYTMFVTPRGSDGNDTSASWGYSQVVNFRFTKPTMKMKVLQSEELTN